MNKIDSFMCVFMYELENYLSSHKDDINRISFQSDEANTDRPLKEYLKSVIETDFNAIPKNSEITGLLNEPKIEISELKKIKIQQVKLPNELTDAEKSMLSEGRSSVYTNPDLCFLINCCGKINYETIELKSTKNDSIPGSSVQQVKPKEWVIFIKHSSNSIEIATGQYLNAINTKFQFPDRSPRPQVSFSELAKWNSIHRKVSTSKQLIYSTDNDTSIKEELLTDWQGVLSKRWIDVLFNKNSIARNEPWFNNNLRKFIVDFLRKYEQLSESQKENFIEKNKRLIADYYSNNEL